VEDSLKKHLVRRAATFQHERLSVSPERNVLPIGALVGFTFLSIELSI
jgi:hypothetical protein